MNIEDFIAISSDEKIQEFLKNIDMDRFCKIVDDYSPFVKVRCGQNMTDRTQIWFEEKIEQSTKSPLGSIEKEEFEKECEELVGRIS